MKIYRVLFFFLRLVDICSSWSTDWKNSAELKRQIYTGVKPAAGSTAGKYSE